MKKFLITGCGKSGTMYMSKLLTSIGIPTSHQRSGQPQDFINNKLPVIPEDKRGDVSWYPCGCLDKLGSDIIIIHQTRNPLHVIRALKRVNFLETDSDAKTLAEKYCPKIKEVNGLAKYMLHWIDCNKKVMSAANYRYDIEDNIFTIIDIILVTVSSKGINSIPDITKNVEMLSKACHSVGDKKNDSKITSKELFNSNESIFNEMICMSSKFGYIIK
jgi:hypothetical protein